MVNKTKLMTSRTYSGTFPSPETPPSGEDGINIGIPKGWSSERVPRSSYRNRRQVASAALMPFSSGRTLPSKWEDAERWICSPVSLGNVSTSSNNNCYYGGTVASSTGPRPGSQLTQSQRRAKSKSGPLGPVGPGYYTGGYHNFSPVLGVGVINGGKWQNSLTIESPGMTSARFEERLGVEIGGDGSEGGRRSCPGHDTVNWLNSWSGPPSPTQGEVNLEDEIHENNEEKYRGEEGVVDRVISRRDMATQMFPESEEISESSRPSSSPKSSMSPTSPHPLLHNNPGSELETDPKRNTQSTEYEVRDVQVDKQANSTRSRSNGNHFREDDNFISSTTIQTTGNHVSKNQREEAKINAWENLQKAKAESAIQKLEEKLEKKRESSMNKIIQKLRRAEIKAHKMRSSLSNDTDDKTSSRAISKIPSFCIKFRLTSSSRSCSTCYPF